MSAGLRATPDSIITLASFINNEWGCTGYVFEGIESYGPLTVGHVCASDGSCFDVMADRWGNRWNVPEGEAWQTMADELIDDIRTQGAR